MTNYKQYLTTAFATATIALFAVPVSAQSPLVGQHTSAEINAANQLLRDGKVDEAIDAYRKVVPGEQHRDELHYNTGVAEYRKGNIDAAEQLFKEAAGTSSSTIAADSRYNLGNCQYAKALQIAEQDKPAAVGLLREAIANYRGALLSQSNNPDARANIELAGELIRKLEQEQKKEEEQKKQDEQQKQEDKQDQKDQSKENKSDQQQQNEQPKNDDQQQDKSQDSESQKDESQKNEEQKDKEQNKNDEQSAADESQQDDQKKDDQKSTEKESQPDQQKPSEPQSQPKSSDNKQKQQQNNQPQTGDQQTPEDEAKPEEQAAKNQQVPLGDLKAASQQDENKKPEGTVGMADPNAKDGLMTREEALKMLQSVRDRDMLRRMQQQRQERSRHVPVDKDW